MNHRSRDPRPNGRGQMMGRGPPMGRGRSRGPMAPLRAPMQGRFPGRGGPMQGRGPPMQGRGPPMQDRGPPQRGRGPMGPMGDRFPPRGRGPPMMGRGGRGPPQQQQQMSGPPGRGPRPGPPPPMNMNMHMRRNSGPPPPPPPMHPMGGGRFPQPQQQQNFNHGPPPNHMMPPPPPSRPTPGTQMQQYNPMMNGMNTRGHPPHMIPNPQYHPQTQHAGAPHPHSHPQHAPPSVHPPVRPLVGPPPAVPAGPTVPTATPVYPKEAIDQAWSEHTAPHGPKYFYNSLSKQSTYEKPEPLKAQEAAVAAAVAAANTPTKVAPWVEHVDPTSGKTYYSNGVTTSWDVPAGYAKLETVAAASAENDPEPPKKKKRVAKKETAFASKEEAVAAFKGLLLAKDISPKMKWTDVHKMLSSNPRWEVCEDVLTAGERKQALAEYQTKRTNELRTIERQERIRTRDSFIQLLSSVLPGLAEFSVWSTRFADIRDHLAKDDRFHVVADEETRESLFLDFCEEFRKLDERKKRNKKRDDKDAFLAFLKENEESGSLTFASTWNSFVASISEEAKMDPRFEVSLNVSENDRHLFFADFVTELQVSEEDKRRRIRDARRRAEKAQREAYRDKLLALAVAGEILPTSRWRTVEGLVTGDVAFGPLQEQNHEAPRELFEEFVDEWNETYRRDRGFLSQLVHPSSNRDIVVSAGTVYEEFTKALLDQAAGSSEMYTEARRIINRESPVSSSRLYFNELLLRSNGSNGNGSGRRSSLRRRAEDSSEDEGEIVEDGEVQTNVETEDSLAPTDSTTMKHEVASSEVSPLG